MLAISVALSGVLLGLIYVALPQRALAAGICLGVALVCGTCLSIVLGLQALLTLLVLLIAGPLHWKRPAVMAGAVASMAAAYLIFFASVAGELRELDALRQQYPVASVAERLAYENPAEVKTAATDAAPVSLSDTVESRLQDAERQYDWSHRRYQLQALHQRSADQFVMARGFGPVRMRGVHRGSIELPDPGPVRLPQGEEYQPDVPQAPVAVEGPVASQPPSTRALLSMHQAGQLDFLHPERLGYVESRQQVAGFEPHRFESMPRPSRPCDSTSTWQIAGIQLISLLKHSAPVAYVSKHLPRMEELRNAPTRPATHFELAALEKLRADEDVVIDDTGRSIRMVGSLRASNECLNCHTVERGALLGALSYELSPAGPPAVEVAPPPDPQADLQRPSALVQAE